MKGAYPVIFTDVDTNIIIEVSDFGILTEANEEGKAKGIFAEDGKGMVVLADVDLTEYRRSDI